METSTKGLCVVCNKAAGLYVCQECQRPFCKKHVAEHNLELAKQMDDVCNTHDLLQQEINEKSVTSNQHPLMMQINEWENECVKKIRNEAEKARKELEQHLTSNKKLITRELETISSQLKRYKETDDYSEKDLVSWKQALKKLKAQLLTPPCIRLEKINDQQWIQRLKITSVTLDSTDKFEKKHGSIEILEDGFVAQKSTQSADSEVRGFKKYTTGIHKISLKIEKMTYNNWMLWGIISQNTVMQNYSYSSTSAYGWAKSNQVYLNGKGNQGYNNYDADIVENDIIHLTLNCDNRMIELENDRTKKKYSIPIDLNNCPFPWQLHVNLYSSNDRIRILK